MTTVTDQPYRRYLCIVCGFIYDEAHGDPDGDLPPGTRYEDIPDDWECPDCGVRKQDFVLLEALPASSSETVISDNRADGLPNNAEQIVIVGGGMAAWALVENIRQRDLTVPIVVISRCSSDIYYKPQISVAATKGQAPDELITSTGEHQANRLNVSLVARTRVLGIDRDQQRLVTPRGGIPYRQLVLALGAQQPKPRLAGNAAHEVMQVNDLISYRQLRGKLDSQPKSRIVILGAGLIGCEFADDLSGAGHQVTLVDLALRPLARLLPEALSHQLTEQFQHKGITIINEMTLNAVEKHEDGHLSVTLTNGQHLETDVVVSALGLSPNIVLASQAGLEVQKGIVIDAKLQTSDKHIFALGDCVEHKAQLLPYIRPLKAQASALGGLLCGETKHYEGKASTIIIKTPSYPIAVWPSQEQGEWVEQSTDEQGATFLHYSHSLNEPPRLTGFALTGSCTRHVKQYEAQMSD
ncbi:FAD-dependent oxidoreductase [Vreelandella neptunia]|uniref:FAD-dependent oxidoreductase n=1 Tax=Vreelandella neptunia TaxID=115551 RepID=A0ABS9S4U5_9GAMM|nr:FAD-dependent oxidoreductase [Halomonas neptunia]MCH4811147.1 FAD-dependent oxidoreductase [Halomonas neptunia]